MLEPTTSSSSGDWRQAITEEMRIETMEKICMASNHNGDLRPKKKIPLKPEIVARLSKHAKRIDKYGLMRNYYKVKGVEESLFNKANSVEDYHRLIEEKCEVLRNNCEKCARDGTDDLLMADAAFVANLESLLESGASDEVLVQQIYTRQDLAVDSYIF